MARPLSAASSIPPLELTSRGKSYLCHWGVLACDRRVTEVQDLQRPGDAFQDAIGALWELQRLEGNRNTWNVTRPFNASDWNMCSAKYLGVTTMNDEQIQNEGIEN